MNNSIKKLRYTALVVFACSLLVGCNLLAPKPKMNPLQLQDMQTHQFHANKTATYNAITTVLQNQGYTIKSSNFDTGLITAQGLASGSSSEGIVSNLLFGSSDEGSADTTYFLISAYIETINQNTTSARFNLIAVEKTAEKHGAKTETDTQIQKPDTYQKIFTKIEQNIETK
ncbi:MAG: hypothetical protein KAT71_04665 [Gammaproteobacteria bacterium]|nr:hypothetical protein [Gammaproteobacteria bacterium]